jgi:uncharacterized protein Smg (DUF494 family)
MSIPFVETEDYKSILEHCTYNNEQLLILNAVVMALISYLTHRGVVNAEELDGIIEKVVQETLTTFNTYLQSHLDKINEQPSSE